MNFVTSFKCLPTVALRYQMPFGEPATIRERVVTMRVFMLGWEFPPFISGGLGTACYGLTKAMSALGTDVMFVLPRPVSTPFSTHVSLVSPQPGSPLAAPVTEFRLDEFEHVTFRTVDARLTSPYQTPRQYQETVREGRERPAPAERKPEPAGR